jgi:hypothetical protein
LSLQSIDDIYAYESLPIGVFSVSDNISEKYFLAFLGAAGFLAAVADCFLVVQVS